MLRNLSIFFKLGLGFGVVVFGLLLVTLLSNRALNKLDATSSAIVAESVQLLKAADQADKAANLSAKMELAQKEKGSSNSNLILLFVVFAVLGIGACIFIARSIRSPLSEILSGVEKFKGGDLSPSFGEQTGNEIGHLAGELASTAAILKETYGVDRVDWANLPTGQDQHAADAEVEQGLDQETTKRVGLILETVKLATEGDLTTSCDVTGTDAFGQISDGLNKLIAQLGMSISIVGERARSLMESAGSLTGVSDHMKGSVDQAAEVSKQVSNASQEVDQTLTQITVAQEQMGETVFEIAEKAQEASTMAADAVIKVESTNKLVEELGLRSREIGEVLDVITTIAGQTNLLALNATIEAASAGDAGRGFAVVADEVKNLAKQTANSAKDIGLKIQAIQTSASDTCEAIGETAKIIMDINDIQAGIAAAVEEQSATANEISENVSFAAKGTGEISSGTDSVADFAGQTQKNASDMAVSAESLSTLAKDLHLLVADFKTSDR